MPEHNSIRTYDVVIIGGGPAGAATAIQLLNCGVHSVLIVEKGSYSQKRIGESLPPNTNVLLRQLGVWADFQREGHLPVYGSCSIWGKPEPGYNDYFINPHGVGWHLDRQRFDRFLSRQACRLGAELRMKTRFVQASNHHSNPGYLVLLENVGKQTQQVQTRFVVDASGAQAVFARKVGSSRKVHDRLICISGFFNCQKKHSLSSLTHLEAVEYGWWYLATLPGQSVIAALATDPEVVRQYQLSEPGHWLALLTHTHILPAFIRSQLRLQQQLLVKPALSAHLDQPCGRNWLAVGDAASCYDPISSLGIYKSLASGLQAGKNIAAELQQSGNSTGQYQTFVEADFRKYQESRAYLYNLEKRWPDSPFWQRRKDADQMATISGSKAHLKLQL